MYYNVNKEDGSLIPVAGGTLYADNPIGSILPFGGTVAPSGWFLCQGQALSRTEYADLFKAIGTSFGAGDGSTTFNLPDLRGEFLRGAGANSHTGQGNGSAVGTHQDATKQIALTPWTQQLYFEVGGVPANYDSTKDGPTYQYLQNEAGHTGPQSVPSTYTSRPTNTSVNYIIKAKHTPVPTDFMDKVEEVVEESYSTSIVDSVQNNNMNPITSNAVYKNWKQEYGQAISVSPSGGTEMFTSVVETAMTMKDGNGVNHNLGTGGSHQFHVTWTTGGYLLFIVDVTVVAAIKGGTILTNNAN